MSPQEIANTIEAAEQALCKEDYEQVLSLIEPVLTDLKSDAVLNGNYASAMLVKLGRVLRKVGNDDAYVTAESVLKKASELYPDDLDLFIELGWLHYDRNRFDEALAAFRKGIDSLVPNDKKVLALQGAGASLRMLRRFVEAEEALSEAVKLEDTVCTRTLVERGWLYFYEQNYDRALADFEEVLQRSNVDEEDKRRSLTGQMAVRLIEDAQNKDGCQTRAAELLDTWLSGTSGFPTAEDSLKTVYEAATVHSYLNNCPAALLAIDLVLRSSSADNADYLRFKIEMLTWLRRFDEAEKEYFEAPEKFRNNLDLWIEMGYVYYVQKRFKEALNYFDFQAVQRRFRNDKTKEDLIAELKNNDFANEFTSVVLRKMYRFSDSEKRVDEALVNFGHTAKFLGEKAALYFSKQEYEKAIKVFDRVLKIDAYNEYAHQWRAASFRKLGKFDKAKECLDEAFQKLPTTAALWEERAWLYFDQNDLNRADECFAESIRIDPYWFSRQFSRVEVLARLNRNDEALQILLQLRGQFPNDLEVAEQLGWFYLRRHQPDHAWAQFGFIETKVKDHALGHNGMGGYFLECREYAAAEKYFRSAIKKVDYEPQYHLNLAWALVRQVREPGETRKSEHAISEELLNEAAASCRNALERDPYNATAFSCLGVIAFKRNLLLDAEGYFRKSIELSPQSDGRVELGALYVQTGRYEEAKKEFSEAIGANRNDARTHIEMANLLLLTDNPQEAVRESRQAVSIDPHSDEAYRALAIAMMRAGKYEEAEAVLRKGISNVRSAGLWRLHLLLSQVLTRLGDDNNKETDKNKDYDLYKEALKHVNQAKRLNPPAHSDIFFHAGIVDYKLEDYSSAHRNFKECLQINHERFEAERYSQLVKKMIWEQRRVLMVSTWAGLVLAMVCLIFLIAIATLYYRGTTRVIPESDLATAGNENKQRVAGLQTEKVDGTPSGTPAKQKEESIVDKSMLTFMMPLLLGLLVVAFLLPNLNKLKLPGGFEAEISEPKTKEKISAGPKGEIGFGSSVPIISPGPRGR